MDTSSNATAERLREYLNDARESILFKAEGLSEELARRPMTPTGTHIVGVVHHLAITEYGYFGQCLNREVDNDYVAQLLVIDDPQADFLPPAHLDSQDIINLYRQAIAFADDGFDSLELDSPAQVPWWVKNRNTTLERLMVHMIAETSRHAGHLDIVRELLDGKAGLRPEAMNLPQYTAQQWQAQHRSIQDIADAQIQR